MQFLEGQSLTRALRNLIKKKGELKIAVAYWGSAGLDLLDLNPRRKNLKVVCCLAGGKSDPDLIKRFGRCAKQDDRLHAKIVWTKTGAIVSSANASSNGLPEEEATSKGLIEAGVLVSDRDELASIGEWIDKCYRGARPIKTQDLDDARAARKKRIWNRASSGARTRKQSLIQAMKEGGRLEFDKRRIFFALFRQVLTARELARARAAVRRDKEAITRAYKISDSDFGELDYYFNWPGMPSNAFVIDVESWRRRWRVSPRIFKTFDTKKTWPVRSQDEEVDRLTLIRPASEAFPYLLGTEDRAVVKAVADQLWKRAKGDHSGRVISLKDAATYLLAQAAE
jgi:hypothetical protein